MLFPTALIQLLLMCSPGLPAWPCPSPCDQFSALSSFYIPHWNVVQFASFLSEKAAPPPTPGAAPERAQCGGQEPSAQAATALGRTSVCLFLRALVRTSVCLFLRAPSESTPSRMTPVCRPLPGSFGNYLTASHRNARFGFTLFEAYNSSPRTTMVW